ILTCLRVDLEARPPRAAIEHVGLTAHPERVRAAQLGLFQPPGPAPERLATTIARLAALCRTERVATPAGEESPRPFAAAAARRAVRDLRGELPRRAACAGEGRSALRARAPPSPAGRGLLRSRPFRLPAWRGTRRPRGGSGRSLAARR